MVPEPDKEDQETRARILDTATGLFFRDGLEKTPIQRIIDAVGIAKGTFYHHFRSKDDLMAEVLRRLVDKVLRETQPIVDDPSIDAREKMVRLFRQSGTIKMENMAEALVILRHTLDHTAQDFRKAMEEEAAERTVPLFARILEEGRTDGSLEVDYPQETARLLVGMFMGYRTEAARLMLAAAEGDDAAMERLVRMFKAAEGAMERLLGCPSGSFPIFGVEQMREKLMEVRNGGST